MNTFGAKNEEKLLLHMEETRLEGDFNMSINIRGIIEKES